jgi:outer membrane protein
MIRNTLLMIFSLGAITSLFAQEPLSIEQAIKTGLNNNFQIQITERQVDIAANNNSWGQAGAFPTISLSARMGADGQQDIDSLPPDANAFQQIGVAPAIDLSWVVFNGFRISTTKAQLADLQIQSEGNAAIVVENTIQSIILAYYMAKLNDEALEVTQEVLKLSRDRFNYMLAKKEFGSAVTFDVLQAKNNYLTDSANALQQQLNFDNSIRNLNLVLAQPAENTYELTSDYLLDENTEEFILSDLITKMESSNKTLQNQYIYQEILKKNTRLSQSKLYPTLLLNARIGDQYGGYYSDWEQSTSEWSSQYNYSINFVLSWTLSNGGNVRRAIQNSRISEEIGQIQGEELRRTMQNLLFRTFEEYNLKRQLRQVSLASVESASLNLQIAEEKFRSGAINSFNYRDIQIIYLNAARGLLQANFNLVDSYTELLRLTGGIITEFTEQGQ